MTISSGMTNVLVYPRLEGSRTLIFSQSQTSQANWNEFVTLILSNIIFAFSFLPMKGLISYFTENIEAIRWKISQLLVQPTEKFLGRNLALLVIFSFCYVFFFFISRKVGSSE